MPDQGVRPLEHVVATCNRLAKHFEDKVAWDCNGADAAPVAMPTHFIKAMVEGSVPVNAAWLYV